MVKMYSSNLEVVERAVDAYYLHFDSEEEIDNFLTNNNDINCAGLEYHVDAGWYAWHDADGEWLSADMIRARRREYTELLEDFAMLRAHGEAGN